MLPVRRPWVCAAFLALCAAGAARAEDGVLVVHATYLDRKPLPRVRIGTTGDGSIEVTDVGGRARIRLAPGVKTGQEVGLQVVPGEGDKDSWVFISPWDQRALVPPFDGGRAVPVVLAKKSDKEALLGSGDGRKAIEQSILAEIAKLRQARSEVTEEQRRTVLREQAAAYGLKPEEVDAAIRGAGRKSPDFYEQGLAFLYAKDYPQAAERLGKALAASERELAEAPETERAGARERVADRADFLGAALVEQGRYREAVAAYRRAVEFLGEHAATLNRFGIALTEDGAYPEAEKVLERALAAARSSRSNLEWFIQGNLALVRENRGDLAGARALKEKVLEGMRRQFGADHPETWTAMNNLAFTLRAQGEWARARELEEQVLAALRGKFGTDHPDTLSALSNLSMTLYAQGDLAQARQLGEQVLTGRRGKLGADHPDTLTAMANLASILAGQGDLGQARLLEEQVVAARRSRMGAEHPDTLSAMSNLAQTLVDQGDLARARPLQEQVLEAFRRQLGADHPATLTAMNNLAETLRAQGDLAHARPLQEQVLSARRRELGADHPDTLGAMNNLAMTLADQGDLAQARQLDEQVLEALRRQVGAEHPSTLLAMANLALVLHTQGELAKARLLEEQVLEVRRRVLGPKHPETSLAEWNLLNTRKDMGDETGARELEQSLGWLLDGDEGKLSADQRQIRADLKKMVEKRKN
jgi:tetratricopeptide (TPR) repeat protein